MMGKISKFRNSYLWYSFKNDKFAIGSFLIFMLLL